MNEQAVVDRFEGSKAVILVGEDEMQLVVERRQLPAGAQEGDWLRVEVRGDKLVRAEQDAQSKGRAQERIKGKLGRLRKGDHLR